MHLTVGRTPGRPVLAEERLRENAAPGEVGDMGPDPTGLKSHREELEFHPKYHETPASDLKEC